MTLCMEYVLALKIKKDLEKTSKSLYEMVAVQGIGPRTLRI